MSKRKTPAIPPAPAAVTVNVAQTQLYWRVGKRIRAVVLGEQRAQYGEEIVATLSRHLTAEYGRGFEEKTVLRSAHQQTFHTQDAHAEA